MDTVEMQTDITESFAARRRSQGIIYPRENVDMQSAIFQAMGAAVTLTIIGIMAQIRSKSPRRPFLVKPSNVSVILARYIGDADGQPR